MSKATIYYHFCVVERHLLTYPYKFGYMNTGNFIEPRGVPITEVLLYSDKVGNGRWCIHVFIPSHNTFLYAAHHKRCE